MKFINEGESLDLPPHFNFKKEGGKYLLTNLSKKSIQKAYRSAVAASLELYPLYYERLDTELHLPGRPGATATYENGIVKFVVPEIPHLVKDNDPLQGKQKMLWRELIGYAHAKANIQAKFEKALCLIKVFHTLHAPWDVDNRVYSHIVNAIRYTRLIPDDSSKHLSLMVTGIAGADEPKTEIYIVDMEKIKNKLLEIGISF